MSSGEGVYARILPHKPALHKELSPHLGLCVAQEAPKWQRIPQDLRVQVDFSPHSPPIVMFYRLLALPPGDARSLIALCPRDVLSTRSAEEAGHYLRALGCLLPMWLGLARACEKGKPAAFLTLPSRVVLTGGPVSFETQSRVA